MALKKHVLEGCLAGSLGCMVALTIIGKVKELCLAREKAPQRETV